MSSLCIFTIKEHNLDYINENNLAKELIKIALLNDVAVTFNDSYWQNIIKTAELKDYFTVSNTFLDRDSNFYGIQGILDLTDVVNECCMANNSYCKLSKGDKLFYQKVLKKYGFLEEFINCIFLYDVSKIEVYISDCGCGIIGPEDFYIVKTNSEHFMSDLYESIFDELNNEFNYRFSDTKFEIIK